MMQLMEIIFNPVIKTRSHSVLCRKLTRLVTAKLHKYIPHPERLVTVLITVNNKLNPHLLTHRICICYANTCSWHVLNPGFAKNTPK